MPSLPFQFAPSIHLSRRTLLRWASASAAGALPIFGLNYREALAQEPKSANGSLAPLNRFSRMVQEWFVDQVREAENKIKERLAALKTKADAEAYVRSIQDRIRQSFGPGPERTPLNARVTGVVERDTYKIEKLIFESRPNFPITANLYIPTNRKLPLPGVVGSCGHSATGKAIETYQSFAQGLARLGYVMLIFDPIGQGERLQYVDENLKPKRGLGVGEHLHAGNQQYLVGEFFGAWRAWDGIRALDYLLTRKEVDPNHVGITGNSGGGTMSTWLIGLDRRWTMGAPACFPTTIRRNLENELPQDTEQCPPRTIALGLDHADFLVAMAPKPLIILAKERDYFDVRGAIENFGRLKHIYALLGKPENVALQIGPTEHGYSQENREAMYRWFNRATGVSDAQTEPKLTIEKDEVLQCTPRGQVAEFKPRTVFSFTQEKSRSFADQRGQPSGQELKAAITDVLDLPELPDDPPDFRILRPLRSRPYPRRFATTYAAETEPGIFALVTRLSDVSHLSRPPQDPRPAILYVSHHSADAELRTEPLVKELLASDSDAPFYACDLRGVGESRPDTCGSDQFLNPYGSDYFYSAHAIMLDRPYLGQKTYDLLRVLDWLRSFGHRDIHLAAKGWGALPATFAAVFKNRVKEVTLKQGLTSYATIAESENYNWPLSTLPPAILARFDLPDCYRELTMTKKLRQIDMQGAMAKFE
ncbi:MAG TPA: prolyl oligopeptidase family serine peptidase [Pirellulaceae bacterium]|nr:prolyl oligopeptidase family serine peptidase [Pirellulaceae bacterium]